MADPITASYVQENDDWTIKVAGLGKTLTARAPGIIAARDRTDQLVEKLGPEAKGATVVHLLNGSALEFTTVYMTARLSRPEPAPLTLPEETVAEDLEEAEVAAEPEPQADEQQVKKPVTKSSRRPKAKLIADIGDVLETAKPPKKPRPTRTGSVTVAKAAPRA
jgi:hypothetical protein